MVSSKNVLNSYKIVTLEHFLIRFSRKRRRHRVYVVICPTYWPIPKDTYRNLFQIWMHATAVCSAAENIPHYINTFLTLEIFLFSVNTSFSVTTALCSRNHYSNRIKHFLSSLLKTLYYLLDLQTNITWPLLRFQAIDVKKVNFWTVAVEMAHVWTLKIVDLNDVL